MDLRRVVPVLVQRFEDGGSIDGKHKLWTR